MIGLVPAHAQQARSSSAVAEAGELVIPLNKSQVLRTERPAKDVLIGNPKIADVVVLSDRSIYILGKEIGSTSLTLQGPGGQGATVLDLVVTFDGAGLKSRLAEIMPDEPVEVRAINSGIVLTGAVSSAAQAQRAAAVAERFAPKAVTNLLQVVGSQQVMLHVRFVEMQRSVARDLGLRSVDAALLGGGGTAVFPISVPSSSLLGLTSGATRAESILRAAGAFVQGRFGMSAAFDALEQEGLIRTLAEPNLVAMSGDTANFLAGGEFPIPVAQNSSNANYVQLTVEFKEFGVSLAFTPTVLENGLINLVVSPEVSEIDPTNSITLSALRIPGLSTRRATTTVEIRNGQSFAIAGLLQSNFKDQVRAIPGLGDIPILGALFRSAAFQREETELVIIVTPQLVQPTSPGEVATPDQGFTPPSSADLFLLGRTAGARGALSTGAALGSGGAGGIAGQYGHIIR